MQRRVLMGSMVVALLVPAGALAQRARWDTRTLATIPSPGYPAHAYVHPNGRLYEGTYDNPQGDSLASRVFEFSGDGGSLRAWTVQRQATGEPHGVQVATSDADGRPVLLDKAPPRALILNRGNGRTRLYSAFPGQAVPNFGAWGPDGSLYVTDYDSPVIWRIPPRGGRAKLWLRHPALDGDQFCATGIQLLADGRTLLVGVQSSAGDYGDPTTGRLVKIAIRPSGRAGALTAFWRSQPFDGVDGFAVARSGSVFVALSGAGQIAEVGPDGVERDRSPAAALDYPSSAQFLGQRLIVANQSYTAGDFSRMAIVDVWVGEDGLARPIPRNAGPKH